MSVIVPEAESELVSGFMTEHAAVIFWASILFLPRILDVWVQVTKQVSLVRSGFNDSGVKCGFVLESLGCHHLILRPRVEARKTQDAMLASWSTTEQIISAEGPWFLMYGSRERERLRKSWVVEGPITVGIRLA